MINAYSLYYPLYNLDLDDDYTNDDTISPIFTFKLLYEELERDANVIVLYGDLFREANSNLFSLFEMHFPLNRLRTVDFNENQLRVLLKWYEDNYSLHVKAFHCDTWNSIQVIYNNQGKIKHLHINTYLLKFPIILDYVNNKEIANFIHNYEVVEMCLFY